MNVQGLINNIPHINSVCIEKCRLRIRELSEAIPKKQVLICAGLTSLLYLYNPSLGSCVIKGGMWLAGLGIIVKISAPPLFKIPKVNQLAKQFHFRIYHHLASKGYDIMELMVDAKHQIELFNYDQKKEIERFLNKFHYPSTFSNNGSLFSRTYEIKKGLIKTLTYELSYLLKIPQIKEITKKSFRILHFNSQLVRAKMGVNMLEWLWYSQRDLMTYPERYQIFSEMCKHHPYLMTENSFVKKLLDGELLNRFTKLPYHANQINNLPIDTVQDILNLKFQGLLHIDNMKQHGTHLLDITKEYIEYIGRILLWQYPENWYSYVNVAHTMVQDPNFAMSNADKLSLGIKELGSIDAILDAIKQHKSRTAALEYRRAELVEFQPNAFEVLYQILLNPDKRKEDIWRWCGYCAILCYFYKVPHDLIEKSLPILKALTEIVDPGLRNNLTSILFDHFYPDQKNCIDQFIDLHENGGLHPLIALFLATFNFPIANLSNEEIAIFKYPISQENATYESIMNSLCTLLKDEMLAKHQKNIALRAAFAVGARYPTDPHKGLIELRKHLFLVEAGLRSGEAHIIAKVRTTEALERHFIEEVGLTRIPNFFEKLFDTFGSTEDGVRILMYIRNLKKKRALSNLQTLSALQNYIEAVLEKRFPVRKMANLEVLLQLYEFEKAFVIKVKGSLSEALTTIEDIDVDYDRFLTTKYRRFTKALDYDSDRVINAGYWSLAAEINYEPKQVMENIDATEAAFLWNPELPDNKLAKEKLQLKVQGFIHPAFKSIYYHLLLPKNRNEILWKWLGYCTLVSQAHHVSADRINCSEPILKAMTELRAPLLDKVTRILIEHFYLPFGNEINSFRYFYEKCSLQPILALLLTTLGFTENNFSKEMIDLLGSKSIYKNGPYLRIVIASLSSLVESNAVNFSTKRQILQTIFTSLTSQAKTSHHDVLKCMQLIEVLLLIGEGLSLAKISSLQDLEKIIERKFTKELGLPPIWNFSEKLLKTFGASRYPTAIFVYLGSVNSLNPLHRRAVIPTLRTFVQSILNGNYPTIRYQEANSVHLRTIFGKRPELKVQWCTGESISVQTLMTSQESKESKEEEEPFGSAFMRSQLFNSIVSDVHIQENVFPRLVTCIKHPEQQMKIAQTLRDSVAESKKEASLHDLAELHLIQLLKPDYNFEAQKENLRKALSYLEKLNLNAPQFITDVKDLSTKISAKNIETNNEWTVVDTDDWVDLLLCGTEVLGSCQNIQGQPEYNKCLINDGKARLIAVKNKQGNLLARCFLKILEDEETKQPTLCKERIYLASGVNVNTMHEILNAMVLRKAGKMNLPVFRASTNPHSESKTGRTLRSYTGAVAFEYEDLGRIGITNGAYVVPSSELERMN